MKLVGWNKQAERAELLRESGGCTALTTLSKQGKSWWSTDTWPFVRFAG